MLDRMGRYTYSVGMPTDDLLSISQAAAVSGYAVDTLRRYANEGRLPSLRTEGGHRRFHRSDVEALLAPSEPSEAAG